jgi:hypothetical protein
MLALLFLLMSNRTDYHDLPRNCVDLTETHHAIPMPGAGREDAMRVGITRDGKVYSATSKSPSMIYQMKSKKACVMAQKEGSISRLTHARSTAMPKRFWCRSDSQG